jgi:nitrogen regulatory protein PII
MKMLFIIYSRETDEEVIGAFKRTGIKGYTKLQEACGEGQETDPKLGTHIWPGSNNVLFVAVEDAEVKRVLDMVKQLKKEHPRGGLRGFLLPLEDCV